MIEPLLLLEHVGQRRLAAQVDAGQVDLLHPAPGVEVGVEDRVVLGRGDAGVVERDVDRAVGVLRGPEQRVDLVLVGDVDVHVRRAAELGRDLGAARVVEVADDDLGALLDEPPHRRQPDAGASAGDDRDLAVQPSCHLSSVIGDPSSAVVRWSSCRDLVAGDEDVLLLGERVRRVRAELPAEAGLLEAAERRPVAHRRVRVDAEVAGLDPARDPQRPADVAGEDRAGQAVLGVVGEPRRRRPRRRTASPRRPARTPPRARSARPGRRTAPRSAAPRSPAQVRRRAGEGDLDLVEVAR